MQILTQTPALKSHTNPQMYYPQRETCDNMRICDRMRHIIFHPLYPSLILYYDSKTLFIHHRNQHSNSPPYIRITHTLDSKMLSLSLRYEFCTMHHLTRYNPKIIYDQFCKSLYSNRFCVFKFILIYQMYSALLYIISKRFSFAPRS